jgi:hypothetical protein
MRCPFLDTVSFQTPFSFFFIDLTFLAFDFHLLSPFLDMHSLHRTWGDGLLARGHYSCFIFLGS